MTFSPARPIGIRSRSKAENSFVFVEPCRVEMQSLYEGTLDRDLTADQSALLFGRLKGLLQDVRNGVLSFEGGNPTARVMTRHDCIYEVRARPTRGRLFTRELRLYCGEPQLVARRILGLHLATKPGQAPDVGSEQNEAIDTAVARAEHWELQHLRGNGG